jgi:cytidyltransferase-like protein
MNKTKIGIVSGYFNPIHVGHIQYINSAKEQCDYLICIVNNDYQVNLKKSAKFMDENHRLEIINNIKSIDKAVLSIDSDSSISATLELLTKDINHKNTEVFFFNSGDRSINNENLQEKYICDKNNINRVFIRLPKIFSSSELKRNLSSDNIK